MSGSIYDGLEQVPADFGPSACTIGVFDGVHRGHRALVRRVLADAERNELIPTVVTFDRHPLALIAPGREPKMLSTVQERAQIFLSLGIRAVVVLAFDEELRGLPAERFVSDILVERLRAKRITIGANFRFGKDQAGTIQTLDELSSIYGYETNIFALQMDDDQIVSSSLVRKHLADGQVERAASELDRPFRLTGTVERGAGRGKGLGFPTANLRIDPAMIVPKVGVYAGWAIIEDGQRVPMAVNIGFNPTFEDRSEPVVEAFLLDFDQDLYGRELTLEFLHRLRDEAKFDTPEALIEQIADDVVRTRDLLGLDH
ncbi:MAG: bifunctional riboflavin kinase/FAD synthetase [Actinomycetota bacterium]